MLGITLNHLNVFISINPSYCMVYGISKTNPLISHYEKYPNSSSTCMTISSLKPILAAVQAGLSHKINHNTSTALINTFDFTTQHLALGSSNFVRHAAMPLALHLNTSTFGIKSSSLLWRGSNGDAELRLYRVKVFFIRSLQLDPVDCRHRLVTSS